MSNLDQHTLYSLEMAINAKMAEIERIVTAVLLRAELEKQGYKRIN